MNIKAADLFCGAGGTSTGLKQACDDLGITVELTAINHWKVAIDTHTKNHPAARHLCTSIDNINPRSLFNEGGLHLLWASPECMHHSCARGGKPINDQSRATAWCILRWADALCPPVILVENVPEFADWAPLDGRGRPIKRLKGKTFLAWVQALESLGYRVGWRVLCAADYGDPTTRRRLFVQAVRGRRKIVWPDPTHAREIELDLLNDLKPWRPAREIIDWSIQGTSIYDRKKPLSEKTLRRIMVGLKRYGLRPFIVPGKGRDEQRLNSSDEPVPTVTAQGHIDLATPFLVRMKGTSTASSIDAPLPTVEAGSVKHYLAEPYLVQVAHGENGPSDGRIRSVSDPLPTICGNRGNWAVCEPFIVKFNGAGSARSCAEPLDTITTKDRFGLAMPGIVIDGVEYRVDVRFRMLQPHELAAAQGFPKTYVFTGTKTHQVRQIGNAVPCGLAKAIVITVLTQRSSALDCPTFLAA
jgi:DNA (cytosine-5)-methyltransferase 1